MRWLARIAVFAGIFLLGFLVGPLAWALVTASQASGDRPDRMVAASRLLRAFDEQRAMEIPLSSFDADVFAQDCGYDPEQLFGPDRAPAAGQNWTPYGGYFDLALWHGDEFRREVERRRIHALDDRFGAFAVTFLEQCIRASAFAGPCSGTVETGLDAAGLLDRHSLPDGRPDQRRRGQTICAYLDGIAARRSLPLAPQTSLPSIPRP